jgi:hypothetical protein
VVETTKTGTDALTALRSEVRRLSDRLEDVLDHVYGANVRPPVRERTDGDYPADVVPTSADEGTDQFKKDTKGKGV